MKYLFALRGCAASGKSTFITEHRSLLKPYTLSSDGIRRLFPFKTEIDGTKRTSPYYEEITWRILMSCLEKRMQVDEFVILDCTHYKISSIKQYKKLADKYGFEIIVVDFYTGLTLEEALERNNKREKYKKVPENVVKKQYETIKQNSNKEFKTIKPEQMVEIIKAKKEKIAITNKEVVAMIRNNAKKIFEIFPILNKTIGFDQNNKYHSKTLYEHTRDVIGNLKPTTDEILYYAALFHDIGKIYTKTTDEAGNSHYFGHGEKSCEIVFNSIIPIMKLYAPYKTNDYERLIRYIKYHDLVFEKKPTLEKYYEKGFKNKDEVKNLLNLQQADLNSHNIIDRLIERKKTLEELISNIS